ncbi:AIPR family protein [Streptomyces sp. ML-6]|uniref:AIPR family protein n=1 Tax=Streptomyces sp. ML-6 TaxID=2982693 RepID=UPI0024BF9ABB|nr:AIPR family protein [Streptomyces sp. ML-6]MDK0522192.1 AIPR family protein [Streptomyces sp. ML-6]
MDRVTKSYIEEFKKDQSLGGTSDSETFEHFANYCVTSDIHDDEFLLDDVHTGKANDLGIDGIAILINGTLITSPEEVHDLLIVNGTMDVTFSFVQAKSGGNFSAEQIGSFFDGVKDFFSEDLEVPVNQNIENARETMQEIYQNSTRFRKIKPSCRLSFVTTGEWKADGHIVSKVKKWEGELKSLSLFSSVTFTPMGADEIQSSYQRSKNSVTTEFSFVNRVVLPEIAGVNEAYLGTVPATEFLRLIIDPSDNIRKPLFTENIRDFLEYNSVNTEIQQTLRESATHDRFAVLNNGVTVVTRDLQVTGNKFEISDYQIVNGCQTSHVLFDERSEVSDRIHVPLKVIFTQDEEVINAVITATNRQTAVTGEDLYALSSFQKKLEALMAAYPSKKKLYYERRSRQYSSAIGVEKVRIVTKQQQIKAFAAMFLDEPHKASRYYADLRAMVGKKIFHKDHKLDPYYTSAYAQYKLEYFFRNGALPVRYKPARYQLLMVARYIIASAEMPSFSANKIEAYCAKICNCLWDDKAILEAFIKAIEVVETAEDELGELSREIVKTQAFTDATKRALKNI